MSLAAHLSRLGFDVEVYEKRDSSEGPGQRLIQNDFHFDRKTTVNLFPEILDRFFHQFNHTSSDFYSLKKLDPSFRIFFSADQYFDIQGNIDSTASFFGEIEKHGDRKFRLYMKRAKEEKYKLIDNTLSARTLGLKDITPTRELLPWRLHKRFVNSLFRDSRLRAILEFPTSFLEFVPISSQQHLFALNYTLHSQGIYYPNGGVGKIYNGMLNILDELNVPVNYDSAVSSFDIIDNLISGALTNQKSLHADIYATATDYSSAEHMLSREYRNYMSESLKDRKEHTSTIHFFLGFKTGLSNLKHHNLIFNEGINSFNTDGEKGIDSGFRNMMYIACASKTENDLAPPGMESIVVCMKVPQGVEDTGKLREHYYKICLRRIEEITGQSLEEEVVFKKTITSDEFASETHDISGTHAAIHFKSGILNNNRLKIRNRHLPNLYYADLSGLVGSGISSSILTGEAVASEVHADVIKHS